MRVLLSNSSKKFLYDFLKVKYDCNSGQSLAKSINISYGTLKNWFQEEKRYIPKEIISPEVFYKLEILDEQEDNWGRIKGGRKTYKIIFNKYGLAELKKRQSNGGKKSVQLLSKRRNENPLIIDLESPLFLEFYGILLGDGWLSKLKYKNKIIYLIGISGNKNLDREFHLYCKNAIFTLFKRKPYLKELKNCNGRELLFSHKELHKFLSDYLGFPIGLKKNLQIKEDIFNKGYCKVKYIIRGIFDTDGCFYFDKTPANKSYPCISITMKEPLLMGQLYSILTKNGFKVYHYKSEKIEKLFLKGSKQLRKWMNEIGSSNPYKLQRMKRALMAQLDSATDS